MTSQSPSEIVATALETHGFSPTTQLVEAVVSKIGVAAVKGANTFGLINFMVGDAVKSVASDISNRDPAPVSNHDRALKLVDEKFPNASARDRNRLHTEILSSWERKENATTNEARVRAELAAKDGPLTELDQLSYANAIAADARETARTNGKRENTPGTLKPEDRPTPDALAKMTPIQKLAHANKAASPEIASLKRELATAMKNQAFVQAKGSAADLIAFETRVENLRRRLQIFGVHV